MSWALKISEICKQKGKGTWAFWVEGKALDKSTEAAQCRGTVTWSSCHGSVEMNLTSIHEDAGSIPGLTGLRIQCCSELPCSLLMRLGFCIDVAVAVAVAVA